MAKITGSGKERRYAADVADWCARELTTARATGRIETRPFVQNADLIIAALREYAESGTAPASDGASSSRGIRDPARDRRRDDVVRGQ